MKRIWKGHENLYKITDNNEMDKCILRNDIPKVTQKVGKKMKKLMCFTFKWLTNT